MAGGVPFWGQMLGSEWQNPDTGMMVPQPGYLQGGGMNGGMQGLLGNPLLHIGLGILGANQPGAGFGQAVGQGALGGIKSYGQQQQIGLLGDLRQAQAQKLREDAARQAARAKYVTGGGMPGASAAPVAGPGGLLAGGGATSVAGAVPQAPTGGGGRFPYVPDELLPLIATEADPLKAIEHYYDKSREAPKVESQFNAQGRETKTVWDPKTQSYAPFGGVKTDVLTPEAEGQKVRIAQAGAPSVSVNTAENPFYKGVGGKAADRLDASVGFAQNARKYLMIADEADNLLNKGIISGTGADLRLSWARALNTAGITSDDRVENTEAFFSAMGKQTLELVKNLGAGTSISNADREYAAQIAAGKIDLSEAGIRRAIDINRRAARETIEQHNKTVKPLLDDPNVPSFIKGTLSVEMPESAAMPRAAGLKPIDDEVRRNANNAILKGAPKGKIIQRLREQGYDVGKF